MSSIFIIVLFTLQKSHLGTYIIPIFPLLAICIAILFHHLSSISEIFKKVLYSVFVFALLFAAWVSLGNLYVKVPPYTYEEKAIGQTYRNNSPAPLYSLDWNVHETVNYYGNTKISAIDPRSGSGKILKAPFYLFVTIPAETYFFLAPDKPAYEGLKILYQGKIFALIYGDKDLQLPTFICCNR
ncbi:MAG: hypothetical protein G01um101456_17 [Parcubacteria group bacterium Gr01-1014_56]|nr:MAG: hypothetical protein G01um101456_17 [Parcubacteria group bacterium Gr01-1014_56]